LPVKNPSLSGERRAISCSGTSRSSGSRTPGQASVRVWRVTCRWPRRSRADGAHRARSRTPRPVPRGSPWRGPAGRGCRRGPSRRPRTPAPPLPDRGGQLGVLVVGEVEERRRRAPLLALEQHRHERRGQHQGGADLELARREQVARALALGPVAHLVVVLQAADEAVPGRPSAGRPWRAPRWRSSAVVDQPPSSRPWQSASRPKSR
jgi:hypothetical protein